MSSVSMKFSCKCKFQHLSKVEAHVRGMDSALWKTENLMRACRTTYYSAVVQKYEEHAVCS